jgi:hypothetical protein
VSILCVLRFMRDPADSSRARCRSPTELRLQQQEPQVRH